MSEVLQFPSKPRPPRPPAAARSQADNIRALVDCLNWVKPRRGSKPMSRMIKARDDLISFAAKCSAMGKYEPLDVMLTLTGAIASMELAIEAAKRPAW
jgi:hypothetical protein